MTTKRSSAQERQSIRSPGGKHRRNETRTHYLWREEGESLDEVRERFRRMVEEGRASAHHDLHHLSLAVMIARMRRDFPVICLLFPVIFAGFGAIVLSLLHICILPPPLTGIYRERQQQLHEHFSDEEIIELGLFCAETDGVGKVVRSLNVISWEEACSLNPTLQDIPARKGEAA